jgi:hypothetical protein
MFICHPKDEANPYSLMPIGPGPRINAAKVMLEWLREEKGQATPMILKADARFIAELQSESDFLFESQRDHFDYVYSGSDLISLAGRKFHSKKNHLNRFEIKHPSQRYFPLDETLTPECLGVLEKWCGTKDCAGNPVLQAETDAVKEALAHFSGLELKGGVIEIDGRIEAFTIGALLNRDTAVVHVEKADPDIPGLYSAINQRFVREQWPSIPWINREQDLGDPGLRRAKSSYNPAALVEKFKVQFK